MLLYRDQSEKFYTLHQVLAHSVQRTLFMSCFILQWTRLFLTGSRRTISVARVSAKQLRQSQLVNDAKFGNLYPLSGNNETQTQRIPIIPPRRHSWSRNRNPASNRNGPYFSLAWNMPKIF